MGSLRDARFKEQDHAVQPALGCNRLTEELTGVRVLCENSTFPRSAIRSSWISFSIGPSLATTKNMSSFVAGLTTSLLQNQALSWITSEPCVRTFLRSTSVYSHEELNQGLWAVFGAAISCEQYLFDPTVDLGLRIDCIESMYVPFRDVVAHSSIDQARVVLLDVVGHDPPTRRFPWPKWSIDDHNLTT